MKTVWKIMPRRLPLLPSGIWTKSRVLKKHSELDSILQWKTSDFEKADTWYPKPLTKHLLSIQSEQKVEFFYITLNKTPTMLLKTISMIHKPCCKLIPITFLYQNGNTKFNYFISSLQQHNSKQDGDRRYAH